MIQLASDPAASRASFRPAANNDKSGSSPSLKRGRGGHAWPFLSRPIAPAAPRESGKSGGDSGS